MENAFDLKDLQKEIPFKWRVQSFSKNKPVATCVAYIDARSVMTILDEVVGPENWQSEFYDVNGIMFCKLGIRINSEWVWKSDAGSEGNIEKEKSHASDCLKRAAVSWGIGRFLYELDMVYLPASDKKSKDNWPYVVDEAGKQVWDITKFINDNKKPSVKKPKINVDEIIKKINKCEKIDCLRKIREENQSLESSNPAYKKALAKRYEILAKEKSEKEAEEAFQALNHEKTVGEKIEEAIV